MEFSVFIPLAILMLTLISGVVRDMITLNKRMADINNQNAPYLELLKKSAKQMQLADSLRLGIVTLATTDPVAADIAKDYFPAPPATAKPAAPAKPTDSSGTTKPSGN